MCFAKYSGTLAVKNKTLLLVVPSQNVQIPPCNLHETFGFAIALPGVDIKVKSSDDDE